MSATIYELGYLLKNNLENKSVLAELEKISAEIIHKSEPKPISLAYPIKKQDSAQFAYMHFKVAEPSNILELSNSLKMSSDLLRFIIVKLPEKKITKKKKVIKTEKNKKSEEKFDSLSNEKLEEKLEEFVS